MHELREVLYIILGWLLGLLSQPIVSRIERYYRREDIKMALFSELRNLGVRLATACHKIQMHLGDGDKATLRWAKGIYEKYRADCPENILENMDKLLQVPDDQFKAMMNSLKAKDSIGLSLKTFSLPFTESVLESLSVFDSKFQGDIFEVHAQISILNEQIEEAILYNRLTFDPSCMNTNKDIIISNLKNSYNRIQERCKLIVGKIDKILEK